MEIKQARKILEQNGDNYTDIQLQAIIDSLNKIIEVGLQQFETIKEIKEFDNDTSVN